MRFIISDKTHRGQRAAQEEEKNHTLDIVEEKNQHKLGLPVTLREKGHGSTFTTDMRVHLVFV